MHLTEFLTSQQSPDLSGIFVMRFQGKDYPASFFSQLLRTLKERTSCASLDAQGESLATIKARLGMSFLGTSLLYWVKNTHSLDAATKKDWEAFVKMYQGPHCILYFTKSLTNTLGDSSRVIELPEKINRVFYRALVSFFYPGIAFDSSFLNRLFREQDTLGLDEACLLMAYHRVVGARSDSFFKEWFSKLVVPQKSLFALSQHFFAQRPTQFFTALKSCKDDFPHEFWIAYWSEQLWQATLFVARARNQGILEAKKGAYRLPFSFINKDWQRHKKQSLVAAHQALYKIDYNMKNGSKLPGLELWYHRFLRKTG